jgi:DNA-binding LacI/PurR family transcriptional regulator
MRNPFYTSALDDFVHRFQEVGYSVLALSVPRASEADSVVRKILPYQVDGIVITASSISPQMGITCRDRRVPVVIFNRHIAGVHAHTVCCDNLDGGRMAADGLLQSGARSFGIIYGEQGVVNFDRMSGFKQRLQEAGFEATSIPAVCGYTTFSGGYEAALQVLNSPTRPDGLFCTNDVMAFGAIEAARYAMNMRVPEDLRIIGFDGIADSERPSYSLSTVQQPVMQMIAETVDIITSDRPDRLSSTTHFLKGTLVKRDSTRNSSDHRARSPSARKRWVKAAN